MNFADILNQWERDPEHPRMARKDETPRGTSPGALPPSPRRLPLQAVIDLHGSTQAETLERLDRFVTISQERGLRKILIVHGKGLHSDTGGVLQQTVQTFIESDPRLGAWGHPSAKDGGSGATWAIVKSDAPSCVISDGVVY